MSKTFVPSPQQSAVFQWIESGVGNAVVEAVAGAGKTTTLIQALKRAEGTVTFCAFNKKIVSEIKAKVLEQFGEMPNRFRIGTMHSLGLGALRRAVTKLKRDDAIDPAKRREIVMSILPKEVREDEIAADLTWKLVGYARQRGFGVLVHPSSYESWLNIVEHFSLTEELPENDGPTMEEVIGYAQRVLQKMMEPTSFIDYEDMIWLPLVWKLKPWQTDWIFVDEAQDLNPSRRALSRILVKPYGRAVFVGDPCQAIFGFTGADADSIDLIRRDFHAQTLPLTVTYRCPKAVVDFAHRWVQHIQAHPSAPEGAVITWNPDKGDWTKELKVGDAVLCRNTKPLVSLCFNFIRRGMPAYVEGRDIGKGLIGLTNKWKTNSLRAFLTKLQEWTDEEVASLQAKNKGLQVEAALDRLETMKVLAEGCETLDELRGKIRQIFDDNENSTKPRITLSTIHKAKGREWRRVFWYQRLLLQPSPFAKQEWEKEQERFLQYVAATRAQDTLYDVS